MKLSKKKVEHACGCGNKTACSIIKMHGVLFAGAAMSFSDVEINDKGHPNKLPFKGVLLLLDQPSTKPPHGARGHRILVPKAVAEQVLDSLVGMGVNYDPGLGSHAPRRKVGVITKAWIVGNKVYVAGIIYKKDFPEAEKDLRRQGMGMSMELADVYVRDDNEPVWYLQNFQFTGATILYKNDAAYYGTSLAARAAATRKGEARMANKPEKQKKVAATGESVIDYDKLGASISRAVATENQKLVQGMAASVEQLGRRMDEMTQVITLQAAAAGADDDDPVEVSASEDAIEAAGDPSDPSDPSDSSDPSDPSEEDEDASDVEAMEDLEEEAPHSEPGDVNHAMKTKGRKTTTTDVGAEAVGGKPFPNLSKVKAKGISASAQMVLAQIQARAEKRMKKVSIQAAAAIKENRKLKATVSRLEAQVERFTEMEDRRTSATIPRDLSNLAAKSGVDLREIQASGAKLSVEQVDMMIAQFGDGLDVTKRMEIKNRFLQQGLMEDGQIVRGYTQ